MNVHADGLAWVGGRVVPMDQAAVPVTDRGFLLADSVFETVRTYAGRPFLMGEHLDRLRASAATLHLPIPWTDARFAAVVDELLADWGREASLRIMVTRGDGGSGIALPEPQRPRLVVLCRPLVPLDDVLRRRGVKVCLPEGTTAKTGAVPPHVKSGSYLANVLALREARSRGGFEALLRGADGRWAECTTSNFFVVRGGRVVTPGVADHILPGITRALVVRLSRRLGFAVDERPVDDADLFGADELFLTASIKELVPVVDLDGTSVGDGRPGPVFEALLEAFRVEVRRIQGGGVERLADL